MIDIHCHILPGIDDGAPSDSISLDMARMAAQSGVTDIVATPHFDGDSDAPERIEVIRCSYTRLARLLEQERIPIRLHSGAEVLCLPGTPELAQKGLLPTLGAGKYVLAEFYFDEDYYYMDQMLADIASAGYKIVVAHPERYSAIQRDPSRLRRWAREGYVIQLNKGSVLGNFGSRPESAANHILGMGLAHLIASDAHGSHSRTPHMGELAAWVEERCDPDYGKILLHENPRRVVLGKPMVGF